MAYLIYRWCVTVLEGLILILNTCYLDVKNWIWNRHKRTSEKIYEYYTNPDNIKEAWPRDVVKESETVSGSKGKEGSEMKVKGESIWAKTEVRNWAHLNIYFLYDAN